MLINYWYTINCYNIHCCNTKNRNKNHKWKNPKTKLYIDYLLEKVVGSFWAPLASIQESINIVRKMEFFSSSPR